MSEDHPVAVEGVVYDPGEWLDPGWRSMKDRMPPWVQYPGAGGGFGLDGVVLNQREVYLTEQDRMRKNKKTRCVVLKEDKDNNSWAPVRGGGKEGRGKQHRPTGRAMRVRLPRGTVELEGADRRVQGTNSKRSLKRLGTST